MSPSARRDEWTFATVPMPDGRDVEILTYGTGTQGTLVFHSGTPGGLAERPFFADVCDEFGLRFVMAGRPGYGLSSPRPGRVVADVAEDIGHVLDHLGVDTFMTMGCSGGASHTLACAALLSDRCTAAAPVVGTAPIDAENLDYYAGMAAENQQEWKLAEQGRAVIEPWLQRTVQQTQAGAVEEIGDQYGSGFPPVDRELMAGDFGVIMEASFRKAISTGIEGWLEDDLVLVTPWGFDVRDITVPVSVWAGRQDRMISWEHSAWLARAIPGADLHVLADHGHLSIQVAALHDIVEDLVRRSATGTPATTNQGVTS